MPKGNFLKALIVYFIFAVSGATALVYQVIWARWLGLVFGNTTPSISVVLGSFMLGLALGSWLIGRFLHRIGNPLRFYSYMEFGIGIFAVGFPLFVRLVDYLFTVFVNAESPMAYSLTVRAFFSFALLLAPTTLMGATLPLLTEFFRRSPRHTGSWKAGVLYSVNTLGAAIGISAASFIGIELAGVLLTTMIAAALNIAIGLFAYRLSVHAETPQVAFESGGGQTLGAAGKVAVGVLGASGAAALASEVLWTRTFETLIGNSTYAFASIVLLYLIGIAAGSWLLSLFVKKLKSPSLWLAALQLCMGIWIIISLMLFNGITEHISSYRGQAVSLSTLLWNYFKVISLLAPLSLLSGACFPAATRIIEPDSEDARGALIARAYAWNTIGAVLGSLIAGFVIAPNFDYFNSLYSIALLYFVTALSAYVIVGLLRNTLRQKAVAFSMGVISLTFAFLALNMIRAEGNFARHFNSKYQAAEVVFHKSGLQGVTTIIKDKTKALADILLVNGAGMTKKATDTKMMAHLPMLLHPNPENTLVICFGMGTTYRSAVSYGKNVKVVELVKEVLDGFDYFYTDAPSVRSYKNGKMIVNDGRNFLKLTREKFDVITIDPPPPIDGAGVNNLYSKDFIELAKSRLKKGGIMAHWIPFPGSIAGVDDYETFEMLIMTFKEVFPYVYVQRGFTNIGVHLLGSEQQLDITLERFHERISAPSIANDINEWDAVPLSYFNGISQLITSSRDIRPLITDDKPRLEFYLLRTYKNNGKKTFAYNAW